MVDSIHFLLTYGCTYECDHCFLYCSPEAKGTFSPERLEEAMRQGVDAGITGVYFEGGEPFLHYPLLLHGLRLARELSLTAGIVTNAYWAISPAAAELWLRPIAEIGLADLSVSDDAFHGSTSEDSPPRIAAAAARRLGLPVGSICIEPARLEPASVRGQDGAIVGGDVVFRGRAADRLTAGLPRTPVERFTCCPHEDLVAPSRVHLDPYGDVLICQGISIGNVWQTPLRELLTSYVPEEHPIVGPLVRGGPAALIREHGVEGERDAVDACEACFRARRALLERFPDQLRPRQVYGR